MALYRQCSTVLQCPGTSSAQYTLAHDWSKEHQLQVSLILEVLVDAACHTAAQVMLLLLLRLHVPSQTCCCGPCWMLVPCAPHLFLILSHLGFQASCCCLECVGLLVEVSDLRQPGSQGLLQGCRHKQQQQSHVIRQSKHPAKVQTQQQRSWGTFKHSAACKVADAYGKVSVRDSCMRQSEQVHT
jgi:hypothetical protein